MEMEKRSGLVRVVAGVEGRLTGVEERVTEMEERVTWVEGRVRTPCPLEHVVSALVAEMKMQGVQI